MLAANVRGFATRAAFQYAFHSVHAARGRSERKAAVVGPEEQAKRRVFEPLLFHLTAIAICSWARQVFFLCHGKGNVIPIAREANGDQFFPLLDWRLFRFQPISFPPV